MTTDTDLERTRRSAMKATAAAIVLAGSPAAGLAAAVRPDPEASVEFASQTGLRSPRGTAVQVNATLPEGGFIAIFEGDSVDDPIIGVNEPPLGRGQFRNMLIAVADPGPGDHTLTAAVYKDNGDRLLGPGDPAYDAEPDTEVITF